MTGHNPPSQALAPPVLEGIEATTDQFLGLVRALIHEIRTAIEVIEGNELTAVIASIHRQEELCSELTVMPRPAAMLHCYTSPLAESWHEVQGQIDSAVETLRRTSVEYALILESSSRSIELLSALCRGYAGDVTPALARAKAGHGSSINSTWSCEV